MLDQAAIDDLRRVQVPPQALFIDGGWHPAEEGGRMPVTSPIDGTALTDLALAGAGTVYVCTNAS